MKNWDWNQSFNRQGAPIKHRSIAVTSGKGGVGKSSLVVNLGMALSGLGKRVALLDGDLGLSNVEILMGLAPKYNLYDYLQGRADLQQVLEDGPMGVKVISGGRAMLEIASLKDMQLKRLATALNVLEESYDVLLIDTGAGISRTVLSFLAAAEEVIVVVTPDPSSFMDAYSLVKMLCHHSLKTEGLLLANRVADARDGKLVADKFCQVVKNFLPGFNLELLGYIPEDAEMGRAAIKQQPAYIYSPRSRSVKEMVAVAGLLAGEGFVQRATPPESFARKFINLFRRA